MTDRMTPENMTPAEMALATVLAKIAGQTAAAQLRRMGYPAPTDDQFQAIATRHSTLALAAVARLREPDTFTSHDPEALLGELDALLEGIVEGSILAVMGPAPGAPAN